MDGLFLFQNKPSGCRYHPEQCFLARCWEGLEEFRDMAALWAGLCSGDVNVCVEHLPLSRKKQGKTAGDRFLPLTQGNMSPWHLQQGPGHQMPL